MGTVYLIHFEEKVGHAQHYLGFTNDLLERLKQHEKGNGARLMQVVKERGIRWCLCRTWPGTRKLERRLKNHKNGPRLCPLCQQLRKDVMEND